MTQRDRIDPESRIPLEGLLQALPGGFNGIPDLNQRRATLAGMLAQMAAQVPPNENVVFENRTIPGPEGAPDITVRIYRPKGAAGILPGIYHIHGGGMVLGDLENEHLSVLAICEATNTVIVTVDYRLAPENPHPAPVEDCYAGLVWMFENAESLGVDAERIAIYGASAGGGLTIGTALLARDRNGPQARFIMPIYPMIDDRNETPSSQEITEVGIWDRDGNIEAWGWYLGGREADIYAAPARCEDLSGLPPAFIDVGEMDLFRDEDIAFANTCSRPGSPASCTSTPAPTTALRSSQVKRS
ncbi:MAG: alpha/beta hydrolase [Myxococcota bacterium]